MGRLGFLALVWKPVYEKEKLFSKNLTSVFQYKLWHNSVWFLSYYHRRQW